MVFPDGMTVRDLIETLQDMCEHEPGRADWTVRAVGTYQPRPVTEVSVEAVSSGLGTSRTQTLKHGDPMKRMSFVLTTG